MKKLILFLAALCCTAMMQAETIENVPYIDENGVEQICPIATLVNHSDNTWTEGWYYVGKGQFFDARADARRSIVCKGAVHLILGESTVLKVYGNDWYAGIEVSGEGNSLTIYGQKEQSGRLVAQGGDYGAGIGGSGQDGIGNNITINGGRVEAYAGKHACGIGGGLDGQGINITINGGTVLAQGDSGNASAIGSHFGQPASNIFVADKVKVMIEGPSGHSMFYTINSKDRNLLEHSSIEYDIANDIVGSEYFASIDYTPFFADIDKRVVGEQEEVLLRFVESIKQRMVESPLILTFDEADAARNLAKTKIVEAKKLLQYLPEDENIRQQEYIDYIFNTIGSIEQNYMNTLDVDGMVKIKRDEGIGQLQGFTAGYNTGKAEGKADAFGTLGTKQDGPALIVTDKDGKEIILYSPKSVEYIKVKEEE